MTRAVVTDAPVTHEKFLLVQGTKNDFDKEGGTTDGLVEVVDDE